MAGHSPQPWYKAFPRPAVIAHRGASADAPENTLAAFRLAISQGADAVELDVETCASGEIIVIHDSSVDRTTDGMGRVADLPLSEIRSLDAGGWFDPKFRGERIPTLDEVLEEIGPQIAINIELKNVFSLFDDLAEQAALIVKRHGLAHRVFFSSFNPLNFRKLKRHLPETPAGLLTLKGFGRTWMIRAAGLLAGFDAVHPHHLDVSRGLVERCQMLGKPLFPFTVNEPDEIARLAGLGVDGIITDVPAEARGALGMAQPS